MGHQQNMAMLVITRGYTKAPQDIDAGKVEIAELKSPRRHKKRRAAGLVEEWLDRRHPKWVPSR